MSKSKIYALLAWSILNCHYAISQTKFNYNWVSGILHSYKIKYNGSEFKFDSYYDTTGKASLAFLTGGCCISDSTGNLILVSNGCNLIGKNKNFVENGDSIGGRDFILDGNGFATYPQTSILIPFEGNIFYLIVGSVSNSELSLWSNLGHDAVFDMLIYNKIDMNTNGGLGKVIKREIPMLQNAKLSKSQMMACKHSNGKDWWLFKQARGANKVYKFLFCKDTVIDFGTQSFTEPTFSIYDQGGQSMFNEEGTKYATTCRGTGKIFVSDFDRCSGELSNAKVFNLPTLSLHGIGNPGDMDHFSEGLAFSPNGRFLYINMYANIQQLDLQNSDSATAWSVVAELDTTLMAFQSYSNMYLGPDEKLYIGNFSNGSKQMSRIDNPNIKGVGCNFCARCLRMPKAGLMSPPCMPNYDLGAINCWPSDTGNVDGTQILLYPNPANDYLILESEFLKDKANDILIYDLLGQKVFKKTIFSASSKVRLDIQSLTRGVYLLRVGGFVKKFIKE